MLLNPDFEELIHHLNAEKAKFLVVGAYAVIIYTEPRYTKDIDFLVDPTPENAEKVYKALKSFGAPVDTLSLEDLTKSDMVYQVGIEPNRVDILMGIKGFSFEELWKNKKPYDYGKEKVFVIDPQDLIKAKKLAGRPKDLIDVDKIIRAAQLKKR